MQFCRRFSLYLLIAAIFVGCGQTRVAKPSAEDRKKLAKINTQLGLEYIQKGDLEVGLERLEKALEADPNYIDAHNTLALLRSNLGQYDLAERSFKRALSIDPDNSSALNNYGQFLCQLKRHDEGQELFQKAIANPLYRNPDTALSNAGICALNAGDIETAEKRFRSALQINPKLAQTLYQMAIISYGQGRYLSARGYLQRYIEVARHTPKSLWLGVQVERELGDRDAEASYALQLKKNFPDSEEAGRMLESKVQ